MLMPVNMEISRFLGKRFSVALFYGISIMESQTKLLANEQEQQLKKQVQQFGIKPTFHVTRYKDVDYYGGFSLLANFHKITALKGDMEFMENHLGIRSKYNRIGYGGVVGVRYAIKRKWTISAEFNFGNASLLNMGMGHQL
jgi:hypothetical protein